MGKPDKIRKKKSFMFTTRHYSFMSIIGILIGLFCALVIAAMVLFSYRNAGNVQVSFGGVGLFAACLNIIAIICSSISINERDVYITPGIVGIVINGITLLAWIVMMIIAMVA